MPRQHSRRTELRARPQHKNRVVVLTPERWEVVLGVLNDAVLDDPGDIDVRIARNLVLNARHSDDAEASP